MSEFKLTEKQINKLVKIYKEPLSNAFLIDEPNGIKDVIQSKEIVILNRFTGKFIWKLVQMGYLDNVWLKRINYLNKIKEEQFKTGDTFVPIWKVFRTKEDQIHYEWLKTNFYVYRRVEGNQLVVASFESYHMEKDIAYHLNDLNYINDTVINEKAENFLKTFEKANWPLNDGQKRAYHGALSNSFSFLIGSAGTGKTLTISAITNFLDSEGFSFNILSPTGKAAKRASDVTGFKATTVHSYLKLSTVVEEGIKSNINSARPDDVDWIIIDEFSMLSLEILEKILDSKSFKNILFVGDDKQLPSVSPGNFIDKVTNNTETFKVFKLTEIVRQSDDSGILHVADNIIKDTPRMIDWDKYKKDVIFIERQSTPVELLVKNYAKLVEKYGQSNVVLLTPMRKKTLGTNNLNTMIRDILNPCDKKKKEIITDDGVIYREGDLVLNTSNTKQMPKNAKGEVKRTFNKKTKRWSTVKTFNKGSEKYIPNGEVGIIKKILSNKIEIKFDKSSFYFKRKKVKELIHAYAMTIHKSQGSEYKHVILIIDESHKFMLKENLIYTGVTRAKEKLYIYGNKETFNQTSIIKDSKKRKSWFLPMYLEL